MEEISAVEKVQVEVEMVEMEIEEELSRKRGLVGDLEARLKDKKEEENPDIWDVIRAGKKLEEVEYALGKLTNKRAGLLTAKIYMQKGGK